MSAIAEGLYRRSRHSRQTSDLALIALFCWAGLMLSLAMIHIGIDFTPVM